jgi:hypothetical protein
LVSGRAILQLAAWDRNARRFRGAGILLAVLHLHWPAKNRRQDAGAIKNPAIFAKKYLPVLELSRVLFIEGGWECNSWKR